MTNLSAVDFGDVGVGDIEGELFPSVSHGFAVAAPRGEKLDKRHLL